MAEMSVTDGIIIGAVGGAFAGITVRLAGFAYSKIDEWRHKRRVHRWLLNNTANEDGKRYRSTRAIASWNNLTEDRTRYICSVHEKIYLSTGTQEDMWSIYERGDRGVNEKRGLPSV